MADEKDATRPRQLPEDQTDPEDLTTCPTCGETYDGSWADLSFFHNSGHTITDAPHVRGERVDTSDRVCPSPDPRQMQPRASG